jgi:hypothetical protein
VGVVGRGTELLYTGGGRVGRSSTVDVTNTIQGIIVYYCIKRVFRGVKLVIRFRLLSM